MELRKLHDAVTQFEAESGQSPTSLEELVNPSDGEKKEPCTIVSMVSSP